MIHRTASRGHRLIAKAVNASDTGAETAGWRALEVAAPRIADPTLSAAVQAYDEDLYYADYGDAQDASAVIGAACTALEFGQ